MHSSQGFWALQSCACSLCENHHFASGSATARRFLELSVCGRGFQELSVDCRHHHMTDEIVGVLVCTVYLATAATIPFLLTLAWICLGGSEECRILDATSMPWTTFKVALHWDFQVLAWGGLESLAQDQVTMWQRLTNPGDSAQAQSVTPLWVFWIASIVLIVLPLRCCFGAYTRRNKEYGRDDGKILPASPCSCTSSSGPCPPCSSLRI